MLNYSGEVYSWGKNEGGVLGYQSKDNQFKPKKINELKKINIIACGSLHNLAINNLGEIYSWGSGEGGQLGLSEKILVYINIKLIFLILA